MAKVIKAKMQARGKKFGIAVSRFNEFISQKVVDGAVDTLERYGVDSKAIDIVWTPGSFELPGIAQRMAKSKKYDAILCLGAILRGATPHFDYIASETTKGIAKISLDTGTPCVFGVITADTLEQAIERAGTKEGNRGRQAALTAIEMANLYEEI